MYFVYCNDSPLYDLRDDDLVLVSPTVKLQENSAGSFSFTILPNHPHYDEVQELNTIISVKDGEDEIFCGRIIDISLDYYNRKKVTCEGELGYFNDSIQRQAKYQGETVRSYLERLVSIHNSQVSGAGIDKTFEVGIVTVVDSNDYLYKFTNYESTLEVIKTDLLKTYGGHLRIRKVDGVRYLDYLKDYPNTNTQTIEFGENLLNFTKDMVASDVVTAVIPLGCRLQEQEVEGLEAYLTIKGVNGGKDYVYSESAVRTYGWIFKTVSFQDVTVPDNLKTKGEQYLSDIQFADISLKVTVLDLHMMNADTERIKLLDEIRVISTPNGLDRFFPVSEMTIYLDAPSKNTITLGTSGQKNSLSTKSASNNALIFQKIDNLPKKAEILQEAIENTNALIKSAVNGYIVIGENADELLIMNTNDKQTATKVWKWNLNGLAYSNEGYDGEYDLAITMDGTILGSRLAVNSVQAEHLSTSYKTSVEQQISKAKEEAEDNFSEELKSYWTKTEVETLINQTKDSILISAKETATGLIAEELKAYSTTAEIKVTTDNITSTVNKKVGYTDVISAINQSAESVAIKANKIKLEGLVTANKNFTIDSYGNMSANNGKFTGTITGSTISGSTIEIKQENGVYIYLGTSGLIVDARKYQDIYGEYGGKTSILSGDSVLKGIYSSIVYQTKQGNNWWALMTSGINQMKFNWSISSSPTVTFNTMFGTYGVTAWSSDRRKKKNIVESDVNATAQIKAIPHFAFDWKDKSFHNPCGYVAQDMMLVNPDFVLKIDEKDVDGNPTGNFSYQIDETAIIPIITKAMQEMLKRIERLEQK